MTPQELLKRFKELGASAAPSTVKAEEPGPDGEPRQIRRPAYNICVLPPAIGGAAGEALKTLADCFPVIKAPLRPRGR